MIDKLLVEQIKEETGFIPLIDIEFESAEYIFRQLTPKEYSQICRVVSTKEEMSDAICQVTLIYPADFNFSTSTYPGHSDYIAEEIINFSLINKDLEITDLFDEYRKREDFIYKCQLLVKAAFQEYTLDEIESWTWHKLVDMTARGEEILKLRGCNFSIEYDKELLKNPPEQEEMHYVQAARSGLDPMKMYSNKIEFTKPFLEYPVIAGRSAWNDEVMFGNVQKYFISKG